MNNTTTGIDFPSSIMPSTLMDITGIQNQGWATLKLVTKMCKTVAVILSFCIISILSVFINKYLVGDRRSDEDVSVFVGWVQCLLSVSFMFLLQLGKWISSYSMKSNLKTSSEVSATTHLELLKKVIPLSCTYVGITIFNNLCLKYVGVAFYQMARSFSLIFTVLLTMIILKKSTSWKVFCCCLIVVIGFGLGVSQENVAGTLSVSGVLYGVVASIFTAIFSLLTKRCLDDFNRESIRLTFWNHATSCVVFLPLVIGANQIVTVCKSEYISDVWFWRVLLASGLVRFLLNLVVNKLIDVTGPLSYLMITNAKSVIQTLIAVFYYQESKLPLWWISKGLVVSGATLYAMVKSHEEINTKDKSQFMTINEEIDEEKKLMPENEKEEKNDA